MSFIFLNSFLIYDTCAACVLHVADTFYKLIEDICRNANELFTASEFDMSQFVDISAGAIAAFAPQITSVFVLRRQLLNVTESSDNFRREWIGFAVNNIFRVPNSTYVKEYIELLPTQKVIVSNINSVLRRRSQKHFKSKPIIRCLTILTQTLTRLAQLMLILDTENIHWDNLMDYSNFLREKSHLHKILEHILIFVNNNLSKLTPYTIYKLLMIFWHDGSIVEYFVEGTSTLPQFYTLSCNMLNTFTNILNYFLDEFKSEKWGNLDAFLLGSLVVLRYAIDTNSKKKLKNMLLQIQSFSTHNSLFDNHNLIHHKFCADHNRQVYSTWSTHVMASLLLCCFVVMKKN